MTHIVAMQYTKSFKLHRGGKAANPQELTLVSDWGEQPQPTKRQLRG
ncbi:addiction module toxin RelE [Salmonella enterica subsp. enterica serovar Ekpoui]|nr:addiction module toxin RelE [Salmonella enterica]EBY3009202.1 addiction module toxin RelE [Salmonella enterica subsp. enterica serovar Ekpoui]